MRIIFLLVFSLYIASSLAAHSENGSKDPHHIPHKLSPRSCYWKHICNWVPKQFCRINRVSNCKRVCKRAPHGYNDHNGYDDDTLNQSDPDQVDFWALPFPSPRSHKKLCFMKCDIEPRHICHLRKVKRCFRHWSCY